MDKTIRLSDLETLEEYYDKTGDIVEYVEFKIHKIINFMQKTSGIFTCYILEDSDRIVIRIDSKRYVCNISDVFSETFGNILNDDYYKVEVCDVMYYKFDSLELEGLENNFRTYDYGLDYSLSCSGVMLHSY